MADATNRIEPTNSFRESERNSRLVQLCEKAPREKPKRERSKLAARPLPPRTSDAEQDDEHTLDMLA